MFTNFVAFLKAVFREYILLLTGGTLTAILVLIERYLGHSVSWSWYCVLLLMFVIIASFRAWEKEYVANRNGPDIHLEWAQSDKQIRRDEIHLSNVGKTTATQVTVGRFSWPELFFPEPLVINGIQPNQSEAREPLFVEKLRHPGTANAGHLSEILRSTQNRAREPLQVFVTFRDMNNIVFERAFTCEPGPGGEWGPLIKITPGKLTVKRT